MISILELPKDQKQFKEYGADEYKRILFSMVLSLFPKATPIKSIIQEASRLLRDLPGSRDQTDSDYLVPDAASMIVIQRCLGHLQMATLVHTDAESSDSEVDQAQRDTAAHPQCPLAQQQSDAAPNPDQPTVPSAPQPPAPQQSPLPQQSDAAPNPDQPTVPSAPQPPAPQQSPFPQQSDAAPNPDQAIVPSAPQPPAPQQSPPQQQSDAAPNPDPSTPATAQQQSDDDIHAITTLATEDSCKRKAEDDDPSSDRFSKRPKEASDTEQPPAEADFESNADLKSTPWVDDGGKHQEMAVESEVVMTAVDADLNTVPGEQSVDHPGNDEQHVPMEENEVNRGDLEHMVEEQETVQEPVLESEKGEGEKVDGQEKEDVDMVDDAAAEDLLQQVTEVQGERVDGKKNEDVEMVDDVAAEHLPEQVTKVQEIVDGQENQNVDMVDDVTVDNLPDQVTEVQGEIVDGQENEDVNVVDDVAAENLPDQVTQVQGEIVDGRGNQDVNMVGDFAAENLPDQVTEVQGETVDRQGNRDVNMVGDVAAENLLDPVTEVQGETADEHLHQDQRLDVVETVPGGFEDRQSQCEETGSQPHGCPFGSTPANCSPSLHR